MAQLHTSSGRQRVHEDAVVEHSADERSVAPEPRQAPGEEHAAGADALPATSTRLPTDLADVRERLSIMKKEVDLLQIEVAKPTAPWWRQVSVLVAVGALALSVWTTFYSQQQSSEKDIRDARVELRQLLIAIDDVALVVADVETRYSNPTTVALARNQAITRRNILTNQASQVLDEIGDEVTAAEYFAVGHAIATLGNPADMRITNYFERGLQRGADPSTEVTILRALGDAHFRAGRAEEGRQSFERAFVAAEVWPEQKDVNDGVTNILWATSEVQAGECSGARQRHEVAEEAMERASSNNSVGKDQMRQLADLRATLEQRC